MDMQVGRRRFRWSFFEDDLLVLLGRNGKQDAGLLAGAGGLRVLAAAGKADGPDPRAPGHRNQVGGFVVIKSRQRFYFYSAGSPPWRATKPWVLRPVAEEVPAIFARYTCPRFSMWLSTASK